MSDSKPQVSIEHAWSAHEPKNQVVCEDPFNKLAEKGPADEILIQVTFAEATSLGLAHLVRDEKAIALQKMDPKKRGYMRIGGAHGTQFDRLLSEIEGCGFRYVDGHTFHKPGRKDPTASLYFSKSAEVASQPLPDCIRQLLSEKVFLGVWVHANTLESGIRRDCINCNVADRDFTNPSKLVLAGSAKGDYWLVRGPRPPMVRDDEEQD